MKFVGLIAVICAALALAACGDDSSGSTSESLGPVAKRARPALEFPGGPPPTELLVKDVEVGTGPEAKKGDELSIHYASINEDGEERYGNWSDNPLTFTLGSAGFFEGWDESFEGMKEGGRRELTFPASMTGEARFYVVDLLKIE